MEIAHPEESDSFFLVWDTEERPLFESLGQSWRLCRPVGHKRPTAAAEDTLTSKERRKACSSCFSAQVFYPLQCLSLTRPSNSSIEQGTREPKPLEDILMPQKGAGIEMHWARGRRHPAPVCIPAVWHWEVLRVYIIASSLVFLWVSCVSEQVSLYFQCLLLGFFSFCLFCPITMCCFFCNILLCFVFLLSLKILFISNERQKEWI